MLSCSQPSCERRGFLLMHLPKGCFLPIVLFLWFTASLVLSGGPIVISDGDVEALIEAIEDANDDCGIGDPVTIQLAANGTYTLTDDYEDFNGPTGLPVVRCTLTIHDNHATSSATPAIHSACSGSPATAICTCSTSSSPTV